ncbi:MAG TPA: hypothetical protein VLF62_05600 [Candidatus Saccharimonadales bacterium]|jgi:hypothetical protein|nr:hypothetical protein [Candidatus Saccharimonadales bacterium]
MEGTPRDFDPVNEDASGWGCLRFASAARVLHLLGKNETGIVECPLEFVAFDEHGEQANIAACSANITQTAAGALSVSPDCELQVRWCIQPVDYRQ